MLYGIIYIITNTVNTKVYIGLTTDTLEARWQQHKEGAKYNKRYLEGEVDAPKSKKGMCSVLYRALNLHGYENFTIRKLDEADNKDALNNLEKKYIADYNCISPLGYNLMSGGSNGKHAEETKQRLRIINSENRKKNYAKFRKHNTIADLPQYCINVDKDGDKGVAVNKHPKCPRKNFMSKKYGSLDAAKVALLEFLNELNTTGEAYIKPAKKGDGLPKGIRKVRNAYFVDKTIKGKSYRKSFSNYLEDERNKQAAIEYLNNLINENS
ncbi:group I intron endonuclease [Faustovirus]|nr:hypothetical protein F-LCD7_0215 [Faustovirus]QJX72467.1 group I intron endonuclease [Faustovirus]